MLYLSAVILKRINLFLIYAFVILLLSSPVIALFLICYILRVERNEYPNRTISVNTPSFREIQVYSIDFNKHTYLMFSGELQPDAVVSYSHLSGVVHSPDCTNVICVKNRSSQDVQSVRVDNQNDPIGVIK